MGASRSRVLVAGAGAVGSAVALGLTRAGHAVTLADPAAPGDNASGVAAGMLAPAFESLFDAGGGADFALLRAARDLWPGLASDIGLTLERAGALAVSGKADAESWTRRLLAMGAKARLLAPSEAAAAAPGLAEGLWAVASPDDWRLQPRPALAALRRAAESAGVRWLRARVEAFEHGEARLAGGMTVGADVLVVATGAGQGLTGIVPELAALTPIKGHILRLGTVLAHGPAIRAPGVYICPDAEGAVVGASMEAGLSDLAVDDAVAAGLAARAAALFPGLAGGAYSVRTGVRASTADGLPLVGAGRTSGVLLAVGARRNGWLLAPLIAAAIVRAVGGETPDDLAAALGPARLKLRTPL